MTKNRKYCLLFLITVLILLLGVGFVSAVDTTDNSQVLKDIDELSTPDNYDVDKVVQSDLKTFKSEANVEKTSTNDYNEDNKYLTSECFVNKTIIFITFFKISKKIIKIPI